MRDTRIASFVRERAGERCEYCRLPQIFATLRFHIEHIVPRQHGGSDDPGNLALACPECNLRKGPNLSGVDYRDGSVVQLYHPRNHHWTDHFYWIGTEIGTNTPISRATESLLKLNTSERKRVREFSASRLFVLEEDVPARH